MKFFRRFTKAAVDLPEPGDLDEVVDAWPEGELEGVDDETFERAIAEGRRPDGLSDAA